MGGKKKKTKKKTAKSKEPKGDDKPKKAGEKALAGTSQDLKGKTGSGSPTSAKSLNKDGLPFEPDLTLEDFNLADPFLQSITRNFISLDQRVKRGYKF